MKFPYFKDAVAFITDTAKDGCQIFIPIPSLELKEVYQQQLRDF